MSASYSSTLQGDRMQLVIDRIAGKTPAASTGTGTAGQLVIGTSALSGATGVLATIALATAPFTRSGNVITLAGVPISATASASGTAAKAEFRDNSGTTWINNTLTVGTSGTDIVLNSTSITSGQTVTVTAGTITHG
jgi:hypothetical protein